MSKSSTELTAPGGGTSRPPPAPGAQPPTQYASPAEASSAQAGRILRRLAGMASETVGYGIFKPPTIKKGFDREAPAWRNPVWIGLACDR
jgi:hypothetical protein